jgi:hypothetical protein
MAIYTVAKIELGETKSCVASRYLFIGFGEFLTRVFGNVSHSEADRIGEKSEFFLKLWPSKSLE